MWLNKSGFLVLSVYLFVTVTTSHERPKTSNANHVFNAIHSSMRQWGSSLNHNGMSLFLATVPAGTQLYHGTFKSKPIQGMEWLAFEPEHALIFARPRRPRGPPPNYEDEHWDDGKDGEARQPLDIGPPRSLSSPLEQQQSHHEISTSLPRHRQSEHGQQQPLAPQTSVQDSGYGYLHTYVPKNDLRLLYVDGLSAGKTDNGTLDTQDMLLLNMSSLDPHGPMGGEYERANGMCNLASKLWENKIDGILRMEGGFEIILCDFAKHLERTDVIAITNHVGQVGIFGGWSYIKAVTSRYNGIGDERVKLDYDNFVSVFAYPDVEGLFDNDVQSDYNMPRLQNVSDADRLYIRDEITSMILRKDWDRVEDARNWQSVADMVVARYSTTLRYLYTNRQIRSDKDALEAYITKLLLPFIDYTSRNETLEIQRCVAQVIPKVPSLPQPPSGLSHRTVNAITHHICETLLASLSIVSAPAHVSSPIVYASRAIELIDNLVEYLQWTTWKECGTCPDEEVCFIPIWPMGSHEDHKNPQCRSENTARDRWGYWGGMGRSGRPPPEGDGDGINRLRKQKSRSSHHEPYS